MRAEAEYDVEDFENRERNKGVYCKFYTAPKLDEKRTSIEGRPMYQEREYIEILAVGNENNIVRRPVTDIDRRRFAPQYKLFKEGLEHQDVGTPLAEIPWLSRSQTEELAYLRIRTIESLSEVSDAVCSKYPGMYELKRKAVAWCKRAEDAAPFTQLHQENEELRNELASMKAMIEEMKKENVARAAKSKAQG